MAARVALLCLLGLLVASPAIAKDNIYYQIGLMWPGAYCAQTKGGCCMPRTGVVPADDFYVSGFTVYDAKTNDTITGCDNAAFNFGEIAELKDLKLYWSNIKCPSNNGKSSWKNSWKKSGVCSGLDEKAYFETALAIRDSINPLSTLVSHGIKPDYELYSVEEIKKALKAEIGVTPLIQCSVGPFKQFQLYQVFVCVEGDGKTLMECPKQGKPFTCSDEILFHPFRKWMLKVTKPSMSDVAFELLDQAELGIESLA